MTTSTTLYEKVIAAVPELVENKLPFLNLEIVLQNDSDGTGDYIAKWDYSTPLPESLAEYLRA